MTDLAARLAAATPEQQRELLTELWLAENPEPEFYGDGFRDDTPAIQWRLGHASFLAMLDLGAFLSAVEGMVPEGWAAQVIIRRDRQGCASLYWFDDDEPMPKTRMHGVSATPALALAAAIAQARGL